MEVILVHLTKHEELILLTICKLKEDAYGVPIRKQIMELTGRSINYGSLCNTLYGLVKKGLITSQESQPQPQKGGRRKVIYSILAVMLTHIPRIRVLISSLRSLAPFERWE